MLHYYRALFRHLTFRKTINLAALYASYHLSRLMKRPLHRGLPFSVSVEPTTSCNLRCPECPSGLRQFSRPTGMLTDAVFRKVIDQLRSTLHTLTFYFQGEPYLHPRFLEMVSYAAQANIFTSTSTNGHYLSAHAAETVRSGLGQLIISIDGTTQEAYARYRVGGDLQKVIAGTREVLRQKKVSRSRSPHVVWQFVVFSHNQHQVSELRALAAKTGVDEVRIKTAQVYDYRNGNALLPDEAYSRYAADAEGNYTVKGNAGDHCWRMWQGCVVTWDGKVVPCCFDKDAQHTLGSLADSTFSSIWRSPAYQSFRGSVITAREKVDICTNCTEGTEVWV